MRFTKFSWAAALAAALVTAACGGGSDDGPAQVAATDAEVPVTASTVKAISGATFGFPNGVPALGTSGPTELRIAAPAGAGTIPTFALQSSAGTATGTMEFGSCIFNVTSSTIPGLADGARIVVLECDIEIDTSGDATGQSIGQPVTLVLDGATSDPITLTVIVDASGKVTITSVDGAAVDVGTVQVQVVTGA